MSRGLRPCPAIVQGGATPARGSSECRQVPSKMAPSSIAIRNWTMSPLTWDDEPGCAFPRGPTRRCQRDSAAAPYAAHRFRLLEHSVCPSNVTGLVIRNRHDSDRTIGRDFNPHVQTRLLNGLNGAVDICLRKARWAAAHLVRDAGAAHLEPFRFFVGCFLGFAMSRATACATSSTSSGPN